MGIKIPKNEKEKLKSLTIEDHREFKMSDSMNVSNKLEMLKNPESTNLKIGTKTPISREGTEVSENEKRLSPVEVLISMGERLKTFIDDTGKKYGLVENNGVEDLLDLESGTFRRWLVRQYYAAYKKPASSEHIKQALEVILANAEHEAENEQVSKRCAHLNGCIYYDLNDEKKRVVRISKYGWSVDVDVPVLFYRNKNMKSQVNPDNHANGDLTILDKYLNFKDENSLILYKVSLISKFIPYISHPIDIFFGSQGASKSSTMRLSKKIVDPSQSELVSMPKSKDDLVVMLSNSYYTCLDNLETLSNETSNLFCMAVTGGYYSKRKLFSDSEEILINLKAPISLNSISVCATKPDLMDRSILLELERISPENRLDEETLLRRQDNDMPRILGAIFDVVAKSLKIVETVKVERLGRLGDFTKYGFAISEALGIGGERFLEAYISNQESANNEAVDSNPVAFLICKLMENRPEWKGTVSELLTVLNTTAESLTISTKTKIYPSEPNVLSRRLNEVKINLENVGITYHIKQSNRGKVITIFNNN